MKAQVSNISRVLDQYSLSGDADRPFRQSVLRQVTVI